MDIALQHISDNMLEKCGAMLLKEDTYRLIEKFREEVPNSFANYFMVGHPGETEDFEELKEFVRKVRFDKGHLRIPGGGTYAAAHYEDGIPSK